MTVLLPFFILHAIAIAFLLFLRVRITPRSPQRENLTFAVLIAARNEEADIGDILSDIQRQDFNEVIVVIDHSEDGTKEVAERHGVEILELTEDFGKKAAIAAGVKSITSDYIVQLDADVRLSTGYLDALKHHVADSPDMLVLPVSLPASYQFIKEIQRNEQAVLLAVSSANDRPILANGANMVYRRDTFEALNAYDSNRHLASGDDHFLLRKMVKEGRKVRTVLDRDLVAEIRPVEGLNEFISQRIRWAGKLWRDFSVFHFLLIVGIACVLILPFVYVFLWNRGFPDTDSATVAFVLTILWYGACLLLLFRINRFLNRPTRFFSGLLASIFFPIYAGMTLLLSTFVKPTWKGRKI